MLLGGICACTTKARWATLLLAAMFGLTKAQGADVQCPNPVPGIQTQSRGIDVTVLDLMPLEAVSGSTGYKGAVIRYTCNNGVKRKIDGIEYDQPDQVWVIQDLPTGQLVSGAQVMTTSDEARENLAIDAGIEGTIKGFTFSASASFKKMQKTLHKKSKKTEFVSATFSGREVALAPKEQLTFGPEAQQAVDNLPSDYLNNQQQYMNFIRVYGTHYMTTATYGGLMQTYQETDTDYYETHNEVEIGAQASAGFDAILKAKGGTTSSTTKIDENFKESTSMAVRYYGGNANLMTDEGIKEWQPTISSNPWAMSSTLQPISQLIRDSNKASQMSAAIQDYVLYVFLDVELPRILKTLPAKEQARGEVNEMLKKIADMKQNVRPLVPDAVANLANEVNELYIRLFSDYYNQDDGLREVNDYDAPFDFVCPAGRIITHIESVHDNYYEDRKWSFGCTYVPHLNDLENCQWTDYVNEFDGDVNFNCPGDMVMKGWSSYHNNHYEDRRHRFMCCNVVGAWPTGCYQTDYVNDFDNPLRLQLVRGQDVITGTYSFHKNYYEDRRWKFIICRLSYYTPPTRRDQRCVSGRFAFNRNNSERCVSVYNLGLNITSEVAFSMDEDRPVAIRRALH